MYVSSPQKDWDNYLPPVLFGYRISPSEVTGESPFFLLYGHQPRLPMDVSMIPPRDISASIAEHRARVIENIEIAHREAKENTQRAQLRMKDYLQSVPVKFQVGGSVWVYTPRNRKGLSKKLAHNWHGPFKIVQFLSPVHCILRAVDNHRVSTTVHVSRLNRFVSPDTRPIRQPTELVDETYLVEDDLPPDSFLTEEAEQLSDLELPEEDTLELPERVVLSFNNSIPANHDACSQVVLEPRSGTREASTSSSSAPAEQQVSSQPNCDVPNRDDDDIYTVEKLLKQRCRDGERQFLVKWLRFPSSQNTWKPISNIFNKRLIDKFYEEHPRAQRLSDPDDTPRVVSMLVDGYFSTSQVLAAISYDVDGPFSALFQASNGAKEPVVQETTARTTLHDEMSDHQPLPPSKMAWDQNRPISAIPSQARTNEMSPCQSSECCLVTITETSPTQAHLSCDPVPKDPRVYCHDRADPVRRMQETFTADLFLPIGHFYACFFSPPLLPILATNTMNLARELPFSPTVWWLPWIPVRWFSLMIQS